MHVSTLALMCGKLAPYRLRAEKLGFRLLRRECVQNPRDIRSCADVHLHPSGVWLDLSASVDRDGGGHVSAEHRTWARNRWGEIVEIVTGHPLRSPDDLASELHDHEALLAKRGLIPLVAAPEHPWQDRVGWYEEVRRSLSFMAPP